MAGSSRLLGKLNEALEGHKYYEAHQLLKTLNFRYTASQKYEELEELLVTSSGFLLDNKQDESGMDVAVMLANLYKTASTEVTEKRVTEVIKLLNKMPNSPERVSYISLIAEWIGSAPLIDKLHVCAAQLHIQERGFDDAWKHTVRLHDGKQAANFAMQIIQGMDGIIRPEELGLITGHLVLSFLAAKRVVQAEDAFVTMVQTQDVSHLTPLLNGIRFLTQAAKTNDPQAFKAIQVIYGLSFSRDPNLMKLVTTAGKAIFNFQDERANRGGGGFMSIFNALMNSGP